MTLRPLCMLLALSLAGLTGCAARTARLDTGSPGDSSCFDIGGLTPSERQLNETLLLKALDSEALYTILGDIKPVSSGFERQDVTVAAPDASAVEVTRRVLATWRCAGDLEAGLQAFARVYDGRRTLHAWVARPSGVRAVMARHATFFAALGLTPTVPVGETLLTIEHAAAGTRFRGYGWLFGYPETAVAFFVEAAASQEQTGELVARDFRSVPTYSHPTNQFVWARPKGALDSDAERAIEARALGVLARYRALRSRFIGPGRPGAVALVREALRRQPHMGQADRSSARDDHSTESDGGTPE